MGYFLAFGLVYIGYSLVDWGHYILNHEDIPLWWLMSGLGTPPPAINVFPVANTPPATPGGKVSITSPTSSGHRPFNPRGNIGAL